jgi:cytochrome subunit of sulfide dehydrogenase
VTASARHLFGALLLALLAPTLVSAHEPPPTVPLCALCHGETGPSPFPGVPTIHGLPPGVIENALYKYREGQRPCRKSECSQDGRCPDMSMCDIAAGLADPDIDLLAYWYGAQPFAAHQDPYDAELAARGREIHDRYCEICHTNLGSDPVDDASMLRGQRKVYLRSALEDFQQGRRSVGLDAMDARFKTFSDEQLDALAEFYSGPAAYPLPGE